MPPSPRNGTTADVARPSFRAFEELASCLTRRYEQQCQGDEPDVYVVLVLGAGASAVSQFPKWNFELRKKVYDEVADLFPGTAFLEQAWLDLSWLIGLPDRGSTPAELRKELLERATLEQICSVACQFPGAEDTIRGIFASGFAAERSWYVEGSGAGPPPVLAYELIAHLLKHGFIDHIVTFNFDELLDTALTNELGANGFQRIYSGHEPRAVHDSSKPTLLKIHGTVSSPETMRFTYMDVSLLTQEMRHHLEKMLGLPAPGGFLDDSPEERRTHPKIRLVSLGYSWQDRNFAHWVAASRDYLDGITVVRKESRLEAGRRVSITPPLLTPLNSKGKRLVRVISNTDVGSRRLSIDELCWALSETVVGRLEGHCAVQPLARHLLLGKLYPHLWAPPSMTDRPEVEDPLRLRARAEILLHLAKAKGMIHTAAAPASPRVQSYLGRLRQQAGFEVTAAGFLEQLGLSGLMTRSPDPEGWDTYFATAPNRRALTRQLAAGLLRSADVSARGTVEVPRVGDGRIVMAKEPSAVFVRRQVDAILDSSDVEVMNEPNPEFGWIFVRPSPIDSYGAFGRYAAELVGGDWTHLLAITESWRWLGYDWMRRAGRRGSRGRKVLAILPSDRGLEHWKLKREYLLPCGPEDDSYTCLEVRIPWWTHNRHLLLAIRIAPTTSELLGGIYYTRPFRRSTIAPVAIEGVRDGCKLLGTFLRYCRRLDHPDHADPRFRAGVAEVVSGLLPSLEAKPEMKPYVTVLYERLGWSSPAAAGGSGSRRRAPVAGTAEAAARRSTQ